MIGPRGPPAARIPRGSVPSSGGHQVRRSLPNASASAVRASLRFEVDPAREYQLQCYRRMSPGEKLATAAALYWSARRLKAAFLRQQHPDWSDEQLEREVRSVFTHVRD